MDLFGVVLRTLLPLFLLIGLGHLLRRSSVVRPEHAPVLNGWVLNVLLPATIVLGLQKAPTPTLALLSLPVLLFVLEFAAVGGMFLVARSARLDGPSTGALMLTGPFGNSVFLAYPVVLALLPSQFPAAVLMDELGVTIAMYLLAPWLAGRFLGGGEPFGRTLAKMGRSPLIWSLVIGLLARYAPWPAGLLTAAPMVWLGSVVGPTLEYLSRATTPLALLALGLALDPRGGGGPAWAVGVSVFVKNAAMPFAMWALCNTFGIVGEMRQVAVLMSAMPSAVATAILSEQFGLNHRFAVMAVCVGTAASVVTLPLIWTLLR